MSTSPRPTTCFPIWKIEAPRSAVLLIFAVVCALAIAPSLATAQNDLRPNVFFGFEYVLAPLAVKWACGGDSTGDVGVIERLIAAFPDDAAASEIKAILAETRAGIADGTAMAEFLGPSMTPKQRQDICALALPLNLSWLTPDAMMAGKETAPPEQSDAWRKFHEFMERL